MEFVSTIIILAVMYGLGFLFSLIHIIVLFFNPHTIEEKIEMWKRSVFYISAFVTVFNLFMPGLTTLIITCVVTSAFVQQILMLGKKDFLEKLENLNNI